MSDPVSASVLAAAAIFMGAMIHVIYTDLTQQRIPNRIVLLLLAAFLPLAAVSGFSFQTIAFAIGSAILIFVAGFGCFYAGWLGGGDVKLAAVCALWLGPGTVIHFVLWTAILGSIVTLSILALRRKRALETGQEYRRDRFLPYGPGMALAAIILFPQSSWVLT